VHGEFPVLLDEVVLHAAGLGRNEDLGPVEAVFSHRSPPMRPPPPAGAPCPLPGAGSGAFKSTPCKCIEMKRPGYFVKYITGSPIHRSRQIGSAVSDRLALNPTGGRDLARQQVATLRDSDWYNTGYPMEANPQRSTGGLALDHLRFAQMGVST